MKRMLQNTSKRKGIAVVVSTAVMFAVIGLMFYQETKHSVSFILNGEKQKIRTHADTVHEMLEELEIAVHAEDYLSPSKDSVLKDHSTVVWEQAKPVVLQVDGKKPKEILTAAKSVEELLEQEKLDVTKYDKVRPGRKTELQENMEIAVEKAFPLKLTVAGADKQVWSTSTTVADFLRQQGVKLNKLDRVEPKLSEKVLADSRVNVIRVEKVTDVVEEPVQFQVVKQKDVSLAEGKEKIVTNGKKGMVSRQYVVIKENGKEVKRKLLSEKIISERRNKVVAVGAKRTVPVTVSHKESAGREMYVTSTAYTASCNGCSGKTAIGINLKQNPGAKVIAVDPRVIPLGSKVYVEGYGYAIAGDKGGAIKGNKIDVFFASKTDAYRWGVRKVKIKILK